MLAPCRIGQVECVLQSNSQPTWVERAFDAIPVSDLDLSLCCSLRATSPAIEINVGTHCVLQRLDEELFLGLVQLRATELQRHAVEGHLVLFHGRAVGNAKHELLKPRETFREEFLDKLNAPKPHVPHACPQHHHPEHNMRRQTDKQKDHLDDRAEHHRVCDLGSDITVVEPLLIEDLVAEDEEHSNAARNDEGHQAVELQPCENREVPVVERFGLPVHMQEDHAQDEQGPSAHLPFQDECHEDDTQLPQHEQRLKVEAVIFEAHVQETPATHRGHILQAAAAAAEHEPDDERNPEPVEYEAQPGDRCPILVVATVADHIQVHEKPCGVLLDARHALKKKGQDNRIQEEDPDRQHTGQAIVRVRSPDDVF
mmetsp:Transcript_159108/g.510280  ORF Transcript_159108/g.510280 Transcript_159108/m.510280 type:complete len:370 (-) Transcript_159108:420-1529(-)